MSAIPWGELLAAALKMGLAPDAFWRTSLREWRLITAAAQSEALGRAEFEALARAYGDGEINDAG